MTPLSPVFEDDSSDELLSRSSARPSLLGLSASPRVPNRCTAAYSGGKRAGATRCSRKSPATIGVVVASWRIYQEDLRGVEVAA